MNAPVDPFAPVERPEGLQRGRGGFMRAGHKDGTPYVTDPSGALVASGKRKGEPKRLAYGSPSGAGKLIENSTNLEKWGERRLALGIGTDLTLSLAGRCIALVGLDVDSDGYKTTADSIITEAKRRANAMLAAERGTHGHAILEDDDEGRDWITRAGAGELVGIPTEAQAVIVDAYRAMLTKNGLEVLATEASCVDDVWRLAGMLDGILRLMKDLHFALNTGEVVTIPAGTVVVGDKKTGSRRTDAAGVLQYWHGYCIQVASYAQSRPYDTQTETRGEWPWPISQEHALIIHIDIAAAIDGAPVESICSLTWVDLPKARTMGGETVQAAKAWAREKTALSTSQVFDLVGTNAATTAPTGGEERETESVPDAATPEDVAVTQAAATSSPLALVETDAGHEWTPAPIAHVVQGPRPTTTKRSVFDVLPTADTGDDIKRVFGATTAQSLKDFRAWLFERQATLRKLDPTMAALARHWPTGVLTLKQSNDHDIGQLQQIQTAIEDAERELRAPFETNIEPDDIAPTDWLALMLHPVDEGAAIEPLSAEEDAFDLLKAKFGDPKTVEACARFHAITPKDYVIARVLEATAVGGKIDFRDRMARRFSIGRLLLEAANGCEDIVRAHIAFVTGDEAPIDPATPFGAVLARLDAKTAAEAAASCLLTVTFDQNAAGHLYITPPALPEPSPEPPAKKTRKKKQP